MAVHANTYLSPDKKGYTENRDNTYTNMRMLQSLVYAIEDYLAIGDNTCRTQEFIVPHKVHTAIGHINFTYHTATINHRCYRFSDLYRSYNFARSFCGNVHRDITLNLFHIIKTI